MDHASAAAEGLRRWHDCVARRDMGALTALLADEVRFHSPFLWRPKEGKAITAAYLAAAVHVLRGLAYHREATDGTTWMLEFSATVGEMSLKGIDIIRFGADGRIVEFEVLVRPFKGLTALAEAMQQRWASRAEAAPAREPKPASHGIFERSTSVRPSTTNLPKP
jgi:hypothetical protein